MVFSFLQKSQEITNTFRNMENQKDKHILLLFFVELIVSTLLPHSISLEPFRTDLSQHAKL
jgi:hypothetical protein